jgi:hypothetical protein
MAPFAQAFELIEKARPATYGLRTSTKKNKVYGNGL